MADQTQQLDGIYYGATDQVGDGSRYSYDVHVTSGSVEIIGADIQIGAVEIKDHDSTTRLDVETVTSKNALFDQSEDGAHVAIGATADAVVAAGAVGSVSAKLRRLTSDTDAIKTAVETLDNAISGSEMQVDVVASLPAGTNAIGKLAANSGVDIGDVDVTSMPADTFVAEDGSLGKGVLVQGDDGTDRHNLQTDANGYLKTVAQANDGVDIGDVDVASVGALEQTTPTFYNLTLTSADTEYVQALPANTRALQFQCRTAYDIRYAFETGKVATPTSPYSTLKNPSVWYKENILTSGSLYLASSQASVVVEIETWS